MVSFRICRGANRVLVPRRYDAPFRGGTAGDYLARVALDAVDTWNATLAKWRIPQTLLDGAADEPDDGFAARLCSRLTEEGASMETPSRKRAREALPRGGSVLDVGCGAGAASLPLAVPGADGCSGRPARAGQVTGIDETAGVLAAFAARAEALGIESSAVLGRWPEAAGAVPVADVVVCHHVLYYVDQLAPFVSALTDHARARVVLEIPSEHPHIWMRGLWQRLHGLERPDGPTADHAVTALTELGLAVGVEHRDDRTSPWQGREDDLVRHVRQRLYLPAGREPEVRALIREGHTPPQRRRMATLWWPAR